MSPALLASWPLPPHEVIDWHKLAFGSVEVNGHIECRFSAATKTWSPPVLIKDPHLRIHGLSPALNYAQQVFEGMKAHRSSSDAIYLFRPEQNARRFAKSAARMAMAPVPEQLFFDAVQLAVGLNTEYVPPHDAPAALYIRPLLFGDSANVGLSRATDLVFCVYVMPVAPYQSESAANGADAVVIEDVDRCAPNGTGNVKAGANYGPMIGPMEKAKQTGYSLTLHLDSKTQSWIDEFSTSAFIGLIEGKDGLSHKLVVSNSQQIVESVTADSICDIAKDLHMEIEKRRIHVDELASFDQVYAAGTAVVLTPVRSIYRGKKSETIRYTADYANETSIFRKLRYHLLAIQKGSLCDERGWLYPITMPEHFCAESSTQDILKT